MVNALCFGDDSHFLNIFLHSLFHDCIPCEKTGTDENAIMEAISVNAVAY